MDRQQAAEAQAKLQSELEYALGPELPGVFGFGAGLDYQTREPALNVLVDNDFTAHRVISQVSKWIDGLPVRVSQSAPASFD